MSRTYKGKSVETGATSIKGQGASPAIKWLVKKGLIRKGMLVLDYGAGKYGRNAEYLREMGCKVYAYDPHNFNVTGNGFRRGAVTKRKPTGKFHVAFTSFVLNVVPAKVELQIVREVKTYADRVFHITRHLDILEMAEKTLLGKTNNRWITDWYRDKYMRAACVDVMTEQEILETVGDFSHFGFQTGNGKFQRLPKKTAMWRRGYQMLQDRVGQIIWADKQTYEEVTMAAESKIELYLYSDNTEPVRFATRGRGTNGISISVEYDRESMAGDGKIRKGGINISSMGTIGPTRMGRVLQMMSFAMAIYNSGEGSVDKVLPELQKLGIEVHDHREGKQS